jgi:MFS family permease
MSHASEPEGARRGVLLAAVACGILLNPLNSSMIAVALAPLRGAFDAGFHAAAWLIAAFYLASAVGQPVMGRLADLFGHRRLFVAGLLVVALASGLAALSTSLGQLVACRSLQALGSSALFPAGMGIVRRTIHRRQPQALGVIAVFASTSAAIGPTLGGFLVAWQDWHAIFLVNLPMVALGLGLALAVLPPDPPREPSGGLRALDLPGVGLFALALGTGLAFLQSLSAGVAWWALPAALAAAGLFRARELRARPPFVDLRALRRNGPLLGVYLRFALVNVVFYSVFFGIPSFLEEARGDSPERAGVIMLAIAGIGIVVTPPAARVADRRGPRPILLAGALAMCAGTAALLAIGASTGVGWLVLVLAVLGAGAGLNNLALQVGLQRAAGQHEIAAASGLFMTARFTGTMLSASLLAIAFGQRVGTAQLHVLAAALLGASVLALALAVRWRP